MTNHKKDFNQYKIVDDYAVIYFERKDGQVLEGYVTLPVLERLIKLNWHWCAVYKKNIKGYYASHTEYMGTFDGTPLYKIRSLHQWIMPPKEGFVIDHKNHNGLDCRDDNLRYLSNMDNTKNRSGNNKNNTSGYRNVIWSKQMNAWMVILQIDGKHKMVGHSKDVHEAGRIAAEARLKYYGVEQ
jgi:hypothetical protein